MTNNITEHQSEQTEQFLRAIDIISRSLPHTNDAAKMARKDALSFQIAYGFPHIFFTISPADDSSLIINVYSGIDNEMKRRGDTVEKFFERLTKDD